MSQKTETKGTVVRPILTYYFEIVVFNKNLLIISDKSCFNLCNIIRALLCGLYHQVSSKSVSKFLRYKPKSKTYTKTQRNTQTQTPTQTYTHTNTDR